MLINHAQFKSNSVVFAWAAACVGIVAVGIGVFLNDSLQQSTRLNEVVYIGACYWVLAIT
jgi:hypothetical protein